MDNIDEDLFRQGVRGGSFQPSDNTLHAIKSRAYSLLAEAYNKDMVRPLSGRWPILAGAGMLCAHLLSPLVGAMLQMHLCTVGAPLPMQQLSCTRRRLCLQWHTVVGCVAAAFADMRLCQGPQPRIKLSLGSYPYVHTWSGTGRSRHLPHIMLSPLTPDWQM